MKKTYSLFRGIIAAIALLLFSFQSHATHIIGFDFFYTWVSGNTYKITMIAYGDCGPASAAAFGTLPTAAPHICLYDGNTSIDSFSLAIIAPAAGIDLTPLYSPDSFTQCSSLSSDIPGIKQFTYTATYTLPYASATWRFVYNGYNGSASNSGRVAAFTNIVAGSTVQLVDTLNNLTAPNSSPHLDVIPTPFFCLNTACSHTPGAVDPDGDNLSFALVSGMNGTGTPLCAVGGEVSYIFPSTATVPIQTDPGYFDFDSTTGQISFTPNVLQRDLVVYNIEEYRSGVLVGTCQREMTIYTTTCTTAPPEPKFSSPTAGVVVKNNRLEICQTVGNFSVSLNPAEEDTSYHISVVASELPAGATFTTVNDSTNHPNCTFSWTTTGVTPGNYIFYVTYTDDHQPVRNVQTIAYRIIVYPTANCGEITAVDNVVADNGEFAVFPNPSDGSFTISMNKVDNGKMIITDILGKVVATKQITSKTTQADLNYLPAGNYLLKLVTDNTTYHEKIIITR